MVRIKISHIAIFAVCYIAIFAGVVLAFTSRDYAWTLVGLEWLGFLFVSSEVWPKPWRIFWRMNFKLIALLKRRYAHNVNK